MKCIELVEDDDEDDGPKQWGQSQEGQLIRASTGAPPN